MGWNIKKAVKKFGDVVSLGSLSGIEKGLKSISGSGMAGTLLGGGLGYAVGGPIGGLVGASLGGQYDTNQVNADAVAAANDANVALWREQAAYNTPANQVARLRAAGLNPNLFYSQGDPGNMSSSPTMKAAQYDYNYAQAIDKLAMYYQMKNIQAQNANLRAQTDNINAQTALRRTEADYQKLQLDYYHKYGYFPNQAVPNAILQRVESSPALGYLAEKLGTFRGALEVGSPRDKDYAVKEAVRVADKKNLSGAARKKFIDWFVDEYNKTH